MTLFRRGLKDGLPIALGYLSVSFSFGMMAVAQGIPISAAILTSMTCVTSAGQFAGLLVMTSGGNLFELALAQFIINLRYGLMGLSLSQRLDKSVTVPKRLVMAFMDTDEIFAVASSQNEPVTGIYFFGLSILPFLGWTAGTALGATASALLPPLVTDSLQIAVYGMFLAIILPPARKSRPVLMVCLLAVVLSCCFTWIPVINKISAAVSIVICAVAAAGVGALLFPIETEDHE